MPFGGVSQILVLGFSGIPVLEQCLCWCIRLQSALITLSVEIYEHVAFH